MDNKGHLHLLAAGKLEITLLRLVHEVLENHRDFSQSVILAIQPRGVFLGRRLHQLLQEHLPGQKIPYGELDVTFQRDDFRTSKGPLVPNSTRIEFLIENKRVILVDDVLYTGRTIRAALDAMLAFGRPADVELLALVDRIRKRELPIQPKYVGIRVDTIDSEKVIVRLGEGGEEDSIRIESR